jgi:hypothetical protein
VPHNIQANRNIYTLSLDGKYMDTSYIDIAQ